MKGHARICLIASIVAAAGLALCAAPVVDRNLSVSGARATLSVGAVRVPLWSAALAQDPGTFTLENVTLALESTTHTMKTIRFAGVTSPRAEIDALFAPGATAPLSARLAAITAREVVIPELITETRGAFTQRSVYRDIVLSDIAGGRIRRSVVEGVTTQASMPSGTSKASYGRLTADDTDLAALARIYAQGAGSGPNAMTVVQRAFTGENMTVTDERGMTVRIARASGRDFAMRPVTEPLYDFIAKVAQMDGKKNPDPEETRALLASALAIFEVIQFGAMEASGLEFSSEVAKDAVSGRIARLAFTGRTGEKPADLRAEGIEVKVPDGSAGIDLIAFTGFSFDSTVKTLLSLRDKPFDEYKDLDPATLRALIPTVGTIRYSGIVFDVANAMREPNSSMPERVNITLKDMEITADKPLNGIPTLVRLGLQDLAAPIPSQSDQDGLKDLIAMGYRAVNVSFLIAAAWSEAEKEIGVSEVSFSGAEMGRIALKGVIGDAGRELFDPDGTAATIALLGASARSAELVIENGGLFERYLSLEAKKQNKSPDAVRREYGSAAAVVVPLLLGGSDQAKAVGQAVARFIARPVRLRISAKAKSPAGLGIADVIGVTSPAEILGKLDVSAAAEDKL